MTDSQPLQAEKSRWRFSIGVLLVAVAGVSVAVSNFGLVGRHETLTNQVMGLRGIVRNLTVVHPSKISVVGKPRIKFRDLIYEIYIPSEGSFVICGSGGRAEQNNQLPPRVMAPLSPGQHSIEFKILVSDHLDERPTPISLEVILDGRPSIHLPVDPDQYYAADILNATLRFRSVTSFEADEKVVLFDEEPKFSIQRTEDLRFWIQQAVDD